MTDLTIPDVSDREILDVLTALDLAVQQYASIGKAEDSERVSSMLQRVMLENPEDARNALLNHKSHIRVAHLSRRVKDELRLEVEEGKVKPRSSDMVDIEIE